MPAELILLAQVSFMLRRAEPGGLDTAQLIFVLQKFIQLG